MGSLFFSHCRMSLDRMFDRCPHSDSTPIQLVCLGINSRHPVAGNIDARIQNIDPRTRMLLQRPQVAAATIPQQHFQGNQTLQTRVPAARNTITEPYDVLQQQRFPGEYTFYILRSYTQIILCDKYIILFA